MADGTSRNCRTQPLRLGRSPRLAKLHRWAFALAKEKAGRCAYGRMAQLAGVARFPIGATEKGSGGLELQ
jgi:hypothetical protein